MNKKIIALTNQVLAQAPLFSKPCGAIKKLEIPAYTFQVVDENSKPIQVNGTAYSVLSVPEFQKFDFRFQRIDVPIIISKRDDSKFVSKAMTLKFKNFRHGLNECRTNFRNFVFGFNSKGMQESYNPALSTGRFFSARDFQYNMPIMPNNKYTITVVLKNLNEKGGIDVNLPWARGHNNLCARVSNGLRKIPCGLIEQLADRNPTSLQILLPRA